MKNKVSAFAPATVANVGVGFDILGLALNGVGEVATVERCEHRTDVVLDPVPGFPDLSTDPARNTATAGLVQLIRERKLDFGFRVSLKKEIPIGSGLGGSAASAVAAIVAANGLLRKKLSLEEMFEYAMIGEEMASGSRHGDNVAPCLAGGLVLVRAGGNRGWYKIKTPSSLRCVVLLPRLSIKTKTARGLLTPQLPLPKVIEQSANLAGFLLSCWTRDFALMGESLRDVLIEPQRAALIPGFARMQKAALDRGGALGCSISGSGPALFALSANAANAAKVRKLWLKTADEIGLAVQGSWISPVAGRGARVVGAK